MHDFSRIAQQQELYLSLIGDVRQRYGSLPGVDLIGLGAKERKGKSADEWAWRFYVRKKRPLSELKPEEQIPSEIFGVQTDVILHSEEEELVNMTRLNDTQEYRDTRVLGGAPIRNEYFGSDTNSGYGTLGVLARVVGTEQLVGLTCAHVVNAAADSPTAAGHSIGQPRYWVSCCCCPRGKIGTVSTALHYSTAATREFDCALIAIDSDVADRLNASNPSLTQENKILGHNAETDQAAINAAVITISGARSIMCFETVRKRGQGTGLTTGKVVDVAYGEKQMLIRHISEVLVDPNNPDSAIDPNSPPFAGHGDSGAVLIGTDNKVLGMIVAGSMGTYVDGTVTKKRRLARTIATHIKPIMQRLNIKIGGTQFNAMGEPVGGGVNGCELKIWPGGHTNPDLNPPETFESTSFYTTGGNINWEVLAGPGGALIVERDGTAINPGVTTVSNAARIKVRYGNVSVSASTSDAVQVKGTRGAEPAATVFRTVFKITPQPIKAIGTLDTANTKNFIGSSNNRTCGVDKPPASPRYLAKGELTYDILPADIEWSGGIITFTTGSPAGTFGNILSRRQTRYTRGEQADNVANRTHINQPDWVNAGDSSGEDFQAPSSTTRNKIFRLAHKGFNPLIEREGIDHDTYNPDHYFQRYVRAQYRDRLEFFDGTTWVPLTEYTEWSVNLTAVLTSVPHVAPPTPGADVDNIITSGLNEAPLPNTQPTITFTTANPLEVRTGQTNVILTAVPVDAELDVLTDVPNAPPPPPPARPAVQWTQSPVAPVIALTPNPADARNSVQFTAPGVDRAFTFTAVTNDNTAGLLRAPAVPALPTIPNYQSNPVSITVNVVDWQFRLGGYPHNGDNQTEVFQSENFGFPAGTLVDWNVGTGGTAATIVETGNTLAAGRASITVRYDHACADQLVANTVVIQATQGTTWFKRRTVLMVEWAAWPGGQADTGLNPTETFTAAGMGFPGGTLLNWDVSLGVPNGVITSAGGGTRANGVASITVRFDTQSPSVSVRNAVWIQAINPVDGRVAIRARTVFTVTPQAVKANGDPLHPDNALLFGGGLGGVGVATNTGIVDPTMAGVTRHVAKQEQIYDIAPTGIPWNRRLVSFVFDDGGAGPQITNVKFECRASRERLFAAVAAVGAGNRAVLPVNGIPGNDVTWRNDGAADIQDCQYPTNALPNNIFRIDAPGANSQVTARLSIRFNLREFVQFHNGTGWNRITPFSDWFANLSWLNGAPVAPNTAGPGLGAVNVDNTSPVINAGPDQVVAQGAPVVMNVTFADAESDSRSGDFQWVQTAGTPVVLAGAAPFASMSFVAPAVAGRITFRVSANDSTVLLNSHNPGNANGSDTINIDVN